MAQSLVFIILFKSCDSVIHVMKGILFDTRVGREMMISTATSFIISGTINTKSTKPITLVMW